MLGSQTVDAARVDCSSEVVVHLVIIIIIRFQSQHPNNPNIIMVSDWFS